MDRDAVDLISKILKYNPDERLSLEQILLHPFFTKFYPNAISCLKETDNNQYKVFIVSKDTYFFNRYIEEAGEFPVNASSMFHFIQMMEIEHNRPVSFDFHSFRILGFDEVMADSNNLDKYNYDNLLEKYDNLQKEYNDLRTLDY